MIDNRTNSRQISPIMATFRLDPVDGVEKIVAALRAAGGVVRNAAAALAIHETGLHRLIAKIDGGDGGVIVLVEARDGLRRIALADVSRALRARPEVAIKVERAAASVEGA